MRTLFLLLSIALVLAGCDVENFSSTPESSQPAAAARPTATARPLGATPASVATDLQPATVRRVVDGDTIIVVVDGREERLRYIGIDTPESVQPNAPVECFGREAARANASLVEGRTVYLERDVSNRDRFGRLLRYVYVESPRGDLLFVNLELVGQGYAQAVTFPPDVRHAATLRSAERDARDAGRGLWDRC